ncbi:RNA methyltransferase, TrmH family [Candidatus Gastranaerophilus sp. (ex Termes propinquus)]|nr:RNA methyltransferase, TrmH family [Candidatus Gastranaerophilus sp. (ex Termes propinquus)]
MERITSLQNPLVKEFVSLHQKKYRDEQALVLLEGEKSLQAAREAGLEVLHILSFENADTKVMEKISTTKSAPKVVAIAKKPQYELSEFKKMARIALFEDIKDAGNLGTIVRAACAFGIEGILLYGDCTDEFSPKVLRSTAGCAFKVPIMHAGAELEEFKKTHAFIATVVEGGESLKSSDFSDNFILMFGSEASGLSKNLTNICNKKITLNMQKGTESINLALCAGIFFYEISQLG